MINDKVSTTFAVVIVLLALARVVMFILDQRMRRKSLERIEDKIGSKKESPAIVVDDGLGGFTVTDEAAEMIAEMVLRRKSILPFRGPNSIRRGYVHGEAPPPIMAVCEGASVDSVLRRVRSFGGEAKSEAEQQRRAGVIQDEFGPKNHKGVAAWKVR